jgi:hypothetical protein
MKNKTKLDNEKNLNFENDKKKRKKKIINKKERVKKKICKFFKVIF